jgi:hypothetical protein
MLGDSDELILIKFSTTALTIFSGIMNPLTKSRAKNVIDGLQPEGMTNIWSSIDLAFGHAKKASNENVKILLLTDGDSNQNPPMGIIPTLKRCLSKPENASLKNIELTLFGFSDSINSDLLFEISEIMNSSFSFIPDASMVGTSFINYLANSLSINYTQYNITETNLDSMTEITEFPDLSDEYKYEIIRFHIYQTLKNICADSSSKTVNTNMLTVFNNLKTFIENVNRTIDPASEYKQLFVNALKDFKSSNTNEEQIAKALSKQEWFGKWGYHYLLSLSTAHKLRKCHNFRDQSVQAYGNSIFNDLRDTVNDIFCNLLS